MISMKSREREATTSLRACLKTKSRNTRRHLWEQGNPLQIRFQKQIKPQKINRRHSPHKKSKRKVNQQPNRRAKLPYRLLVLLNQESLEPS